MTTVTGTNHIAFRNYLDSLKLSHPVVQLPFEHTGEGNFKSTNGVEMQISEMGASYIAYRITDRRHGRDYAAMARDQQWDALAARIKSDHEKLDTKTKERKLIAAVFEGSLVGLLTSYSPVSHNEIYAALLEQGLEDSVKFFMANTFGIEIFVGVEVASTHLVALKIVNGHSGHIAFGYSGIFKAADYEFNFPLKSRVRHMSTVTKTFDDMKQLVEAVAEVKVDETLRAVSRDMTLKLIEERFPDDKQSTRQASIVTAVKNAEGDNALEISCFIANYTRTRGYKAAATSLINVIMEGIFPSSKEEPVEETEETEEAAE